MFIFALTVQFSVQPCESHTVGALCNTTCIGPSVRTAECDTNLTREKK